MNKYQILRSRGKKLSQIWKTSFEVLNIEPLLVDLCIPWVRNSKEVSKRVKILLAMLIFSAFNQPLFGKLLKQEIMGKPPVLFMNTRHKYLWKSTANNSKTWLGQQMPISDVCQKLNLRINTYPKIYRHRYTHTIYIYLYIHTHPCWFFQFKFHHSSCYSTVSPLLRAWLGITSGLI